jgi:hypothetical protein
MLFPSLKSSRIITDRRLAARHGLSKRCNQLQPIAAGCNRHKLIAGPVLRRWHREGLAGSADTARTQQWGNLLAEGPAWYGDSKHSFAVLEAFDDYASGNQLAIASLEQQRPSGHAGAHGTVGDQQLLEHVAAMIAAPQRAMLVSI